MAANELCVFSVETGKRLTSEGTLKGGKLKQEKVDSGTVLLLAKVEAVPRVGEGCYGS